MRIGAITTIALLTLVLPCQAQDDPASPADLFKAYQKDVRDVSAAYQIEKAKYADAVAAYSRAQTNRARCAKRFWGGDFDAAFTSLDTARAQLEQQNDAIRKTLSTANTALSRTESKRSLLEARFKGKARDDAYWQALLDIRDAGEDGYVAPLRDQIIPATDDYVAAFGTFADIYNTLGRDCAKGVPNHVLLESFDKARDALLGGATSIGDILSKALPHVTVSVDSAASSQASASSSQ